MKTTELLEEDLEELFTKSSGPGGQHVNKVSSRVILRHIPSGTTVSVQDSRSQAKNRQIARERLLEAIRKEEEEAAKRATQAREKRRRQKAKRPKAVKERILETKKRRSLLKRQRSQVNEQPS